MPSSPTALAGGQLGLLSRSEVAVAGAAAEDLLEALGRVPDPRDPRGRRYPLVPVLAIAVCAMLAGARSYAAIAEWAADAPPRLRARLGLPGPVPDLATIWRVLTRWTRPLSIARSGRGSARNSQPGSRPRRWCWRWTARPCAAPAPAAARRRTCWRAWTTAPGWCRDGPQSREGLEEALRPGTPGPPCRLLGRLARHGGGRVVRSEERRNWTGHTNFGRAGAILG
jgi:DDE_Tnp_1-associated